MWLSSRPARVLTTIALLVLSGATFAARQSGAPLNYVIGAQDVLRISVYGQDPKFSGDFTVRPDGKIAMLLIDEIVAAGLTPLELRDVLTRAYSQFFEQPLILINPKQINSRKVTISGAVAKPGEYRLTDRTNVLQLIARAGGLRPNADKENIQIVRRQPDGKPETILFNLTKLFEDRDVTKIPELRPGDQVVVK
jgi:polysaccharide export outer membrane protein